MSIILTEEQKREALKARIAKFNEGFKKLQEETRIAAKPQITPDGPVISLVDLDERNPA